MMAFRASVERVRSLVRAREGDGEFNDEIRTHLEKLAADHVGRGCSGENNRRARFYTITKAGKKQLPAEEENWARTVAMLQRMLGEEG